MPSKWTHPIHARGVRSPKMDFGHVGKILTNRQIDKYARSGRYGTERQEAALTKLKTKKQKQSSLLRQALKLLGLK